MKVIPFKIPRSSEEGIRVQIDDVPHLYNHLHQHPEIQLTLIQKSRGTLIAGDYVGRFSEGDVFVIGSNQPHVFRNDAVYFKKRLSAKAITIFFDENSMGKQFWALNEMKSFIPFFHHSQGGYRITGRKQIQLIESLQQISVAEGIDKLMLFLQMLQLLSTRKEMKALSRIIIQRPIKDVDGNRLNKVLEYTFLNNKEEINLTEIAGVANMTVESFCKYFKTRTGKTYIHFLQEIRVTNACTLLLQDDKPISTICYESGFANLSNFNRVFKKITNKTPKEYRGVI